MDWQAALTGFLGGLSKGIYERGMLEKEKQLRQQEWEERFNYEQRRMMAEENFKRQLDQEKAAAVDQAYNDVIGMFGKNVQKTAGMAMGIPAGLEPFSPAAMLMGHQTGTGSMTYHQAYNDLIKQIYTPMQQGVKTQQAEERINISKGNLAARKAEIPGKVETREITKETKEENLAKIRKEKTIEEQRDLRFKNANAFLQQSVPPEARPYLQDAHRVFLNTMNKKGGFSDFSGELQINNYLQSRYPNIIANTEEGKKLNNYWNDIINRIWRTYLDAYNAPGHQGRK